MDKENAMHVLLVALARRKKLHAIPVNSEMRAPMGLAQFVRMEPHRIRSRLRASRVCLLMLVQVDHAVCVQREASHWRTAPDARHARLGLRALVASVHNVCLGASRIQISLRVQHVHRTLLVSTGRALHVQMGLHRMGIRRRASHVRRLMRGREECAQCVRREASRIVTSPRV
jgi:hypothetical protein